MKKRFFWLTLLCCTLCLCSCHNKKQVLDKPEDLINRNTMVDIIAESYIIESVIHTSPDSIDKPTMTNLYYCELFNRYHITKEQFISSMEYYISEQSSAEKLLSDASERIAKKRQELNVPEHQLPVPNLADIVVEE